MVDAHFFSRNLESDSVDLLVQPGVYRLNALHVNRSRPNLIAPDFDNLVTDRVSTGSLSIDAESASGGIELEITGPCELVFTMRVPPDQELLGG